MDKKEINQDLIDMKELIATALEALKAKDIKKAEEKLLEIRDVIEELECWKSDEEMDDSDIDVLKEESRRGMRT